MFHSCVRQPAAWAACLAISGGLLAACSGSGESSADAVDRAIAEGRAEDGWALAAAAVRADSSSATAWLSRARAALATGRTVAGIEAANRAAELAGGRAEAHLLRAYLEQKRLWNRAAVAAADSARILAPSDLSCVRATGELRLASGMVGTPDYAGAEVAFREALTLDSTDVRSSFGLGKVLMLTGREGEAAPWLARVLADHPAWGEANYLQGLVHLRHHDCEEAARDFEAATRFEPMHSAAWFNRARVLQRLGRQEDASLARANADRLRDRDRRVKTAIVAWHDNGSLKEGLELVLLLREAAEWEDARALARTLSIDFPRLPRAGLELAESALLAGAPDEAEVAADRAVELTPRNARARLVAARAAEAAGHRETALAHAHSAMELSPDDPESASLLGRLLVTNGNAARALAPLDAVASLGVRDARIAECRAEAWIALGRYEEAEVLLGRLLAAQSRPEWLELRAKARCGRGRWSRALDDLHLATELAPRRVEAWRELATVLENADRRDEAGACRRRADAIQAENLAADEALAAWRAAPYAPETARVAVERLRVAERYGDAGRVTRLSVGFGERP